MHRYTQENITKLAPNEVFVFGSNEAGKHGAGAAYTAKRKFGAIYGQGVGLQGQSYALPTKDKNIQTLPLSKIQKYVTEFLKFAKSRPDLTFLVTKIGNGLAGIPIKDIAPMFNNVYFDFSYCNVILPKEFWDWVGEADGMS